MSQQGKLEGRLKALAAAVLALMQEGAPPAEQMPAWIRPRPSREDWPPTSPWRWRRR